MASARTPSRRKLSAERIRYGFQVHATKTVGGEARSLVDEHASKVTQMATWMSVHLLLVQGTFPGFRSTA
jgi:hypothetical protein